MMELLGVLVGNVGLLRRDKGRRRNLVSDEWITEDVNDVDTSFLFELVEQWRATRSTVLCSQYTPAERRDRLGDGVQADAMFDRLVHGCIRIDLSDVNVRKLLADKK